MTHAEKMARDDAITEALRAADAAIGDDLPTDQALRVIAALKGLRSGRPVTHAGLQAVDYLERVQRLARARWAETHGPDDTGPEHDAVAGVDTPIGRLKLITWRRRWKGERRGLRIAWAGEYYLDDEPITIAEIRAAGLAQRPTTRNRRKREDRARPKKID